MLSPQKPGTAASLASLTAALAASLTAVVTAVKEQEKVSSLPGAEGTPVPKQEERLRV